MGQMENDNSFYSSLIRLQEQLNSRGMQGKKDLSDKTPLFRYMPKERFLDIIENNRITLSHISLWQDPFEGYVFKLKDTSDRLRRMYAGFYGQSWTLESRETDLRWRAYSPSGESVRVETTLGELRSLLEFSLRPYAEENILLCGPVRYENNKWFGDMAAEGEWASRELEKREGIARNLFLKKKFFSQEKEYRVICHIGRSGLRELPYDKRNEFTRSDGLLRCPIEAQHRDFINKVVVDPRMSEPDIDRLKCRIIQADRKIKVSQAKYYHWPESK